MEQKPIVVFYHTTSPKNVHALTALHYRRLCIRFIDMCDNFGLHSVHLTCRAEEQFGPEVYVHDYLEPEDIVFNREFLFRDYLNTQGSDNQVFLFTEPDVEFVSEWPELPADCDISLLWRRDARPCISPSWRLCRRSSLPIFDEIYQCIRRQDREWNGDSEAFNQLYANILIQNKGIIERMTHRGVNIQFRSYEDYMKPRCRYSKHHIGEDQKRELIKQT